MSNDRIISALLKERSDCAAQGLSDRVAAVDARLRWLGYDAPETATIEPQVETATRKKPTRRKKG